MSLLCSDLGSLSCESRAANNTGWVIKREVFMEGKLEGSLLFLEGKACSFCKFDDGKLVYQYLPNGYEQHFDDKGSSTVKKASSETKKKYDWVFDKLVNYAKLPKGKIEWMDYQGFHPNMEKVFLRGMQDEKGNISEKDFNGYTVGKGNRRRWTQNCRYGAKVVEAKKGNETQRVALDSSVYRRSRANNNNQVYISYSNSYKFELMEVSPTGLLLNSPIEEKGFKLDSGRRDVEELLNDGTVLFADGLRCTPENGKLYFLGTQGWSLRYDMVHSRVTDYDSKNFNYHETKNEIEIKYSGKMMNSYEQVHDFVVTGRYDKNGKLQSFNGRIDKKTGFILDDENQKTTLDKNVKPSYQHCVYEFSHDLKTGLLTTGCVKSYYENVGTEWEVSKDDFSPNVYYAKNNDLSIDSLINGLDLPPMKFREYTYEYDEEPKKRNWARVYKNGKPFNGVFEEVNDDGTFVVYEMKNGELVVDANVADKTNDNIQQEQAVDTKQKQALETRHEKVADTEVLLQPKKKNTYLSSVRDKLFKHTSKMFRVHSTVEKQGERKLDSRLVKILNSKENE